MKAFFDTSVLIATFYSNHQFHAPSIEVFSRFRKPQAGCGVHSLAVVYASLTGRSGQDRARPDEAMLFLKDLRSQLTVITLNGREYAEALETSAALGLAGGAIYDAILGRCAVKAQARALYTWNTRDFVRLGPAIASIVRTPVD